MWKRIKVRKKYQEGKLEKRLETIQSSGKRRRRLHYKDRNEMSDLKKADKDNVTGRKGSLTHLDTEKKQ